LLSLKVDPETSQGLCVLHDEIFLVELSVLLLVPILEERGGHDELVEVGCRVIGNFGVISDFGCESRDVFSKMGQDLHIEPPIVGLELFPVALERAPEFCNFGGRPLYLFGWFIREQDLRPRIQ
jgi:hypothetical protein